jgi:pyruvate dehydrogenase complex dehydrogenase (E1) component
MKQKIIMAKNKNITYYNEVTQEILIAPIFEEHCYFLGTLSDKQLDRVKKYREKNGFMSYNEFSKFVDKKVLKII